MNKEELQKILEEHKKWLDDGEGGKRANLWGANLQRADLQRADLREADLRGANLRRAKLQLPDLCILKDQPPNIKLIAFKFLAKDLLSPYENFQYELGKSYTCDDYSEDEREVCGKGFNVATRQWCEQNRDKQDTILVKVSFRAKDIIAIPYATDGKFRVKAMKIEEIVERLDD